METWKQSLHSLVDRANCVVCIVLIATVSYSYYVVLLQHTVTCLFSKMTYRIAGNFWWRKLLWIGEKYNFHEENLHRLLPFAAPMDTMLPNFAEKTFANSHKTAKFASFLPWKFPAIWYSSTLTIPNLYLQFSNGGNNNPGEWNSLVPRLSPLRTLARRAWERLVSEHTYC